MLAESFNFIEIEGKRHIHQRYPRLALHVTACRLYPPYHARRPRIDAPWCEECRQAYLDRVPVAV